VCWDAGKEVWIDDQEDWLTHVDEAHDEPFNAEHTTENESKRKREDEDVRTLAQAFSERQGRVHQVVIAVKREESDIDLRSIDSL